MKRINIENRSSRCALFLAAMLLALPGAVNAQLVFMTNNGAITITGYTGPGGAVVIPATTNGFPVTSIANQAFQFRGSVTRVTIPDSVNNIGKLAFFSCSSLASVTIGNGVTNLGDNAFGDCGLTSVTLPNSVVSLGKQVFVDCGSLANISIGTNVTSIGDVAFGNCTHLASVTIPKSLTSFGSYPFYGCSSLTGIYFLGNAPSPASALFFGNNNATVYYLPGTTGWPTPGDLFGGCPTALWLPQAQTRSDCIGAGTNQFAFNITWAKDTVVVVEACTNLASPDWQPISTNTLTGGMSSFSDPDSINYPGRFYRLRTP